MLPITLHITNKHQKHFKAELLITTKKFKILIVDPSYIVKVILFNYNTFYVTQSFSYFFLNLQKILDSSTLNVTFFKTFFLFQNLEKTSFYCERTHYWIERNCQIKRSNLDWKESRLPNWKLGSTLPQMICLKCLSSSFFLSFFGWGVGSKICTPK